VTPSGDGAILTLEPLVEAVRVGVEATGRWTLSGLQKTTSHQFEGRWDGESTRSAYLFFHAEEGPDFASLDIYLDETTGGLTGNVALVVDLAPLGRVGDPRAVLAELGRMSADALPARQARPVTLRLRLEDASEAAADAGTEVRFKLRIPTRTIGQGSGAIRSLMSEAVTAFEGILATDALRRLADGA
jgi:hypothetical protein